MMQDPCCQCLFNLFRKNTTKHRYDRSIFHDSIAFTNGRVGFFDSSGERHGIWADIISKESFYSNLVWVPQSKFLLIGGRADGTVTTWGKDEENNDDIVRQQQNSKKYNIGTNADAHSCGITKLLWSDCNNTKSRLVSIDTGGMCCIWKIDHDNNLVGTMQFDTKMNITCAISLSPYQLRFVSQAGKFIP